MELLNQPVSVTHQQEARYRLFWRVHFYAGMFTAPIIIWAALTGILYAFTPQIEAALYGHLDRVAPQAGRVPLADQVQAAQAAHPDLKVRYVAPAFLPGSTTQVIMGEAESRHAGHNHGKAPDSTLVYVNPNNGAVLGSMGEMERFNVWSKKLHSSFLQGDGYRWIMELAASWLVMLLVTGVYMWWPRKVDGKAMNWRGVLIPRLDKGGRLAWRDLHAIAGIALSLVLAVLMVTGLTWSKYSGEVFKVTRDAIGQKPPSIPMGLKVDIAPSDQRLGWNDIAHIIQREVPDVQPQIVPPRSENGAWRIEKFVRDQPGKRFIFLIHPVSGEILYRSDWGDLPAVAKATAIGIPFHRGEFGLWNQLLVALAAAVALFAVISGIVMWWKRRPKNAAGLHGAPGRIKGGAHALPRWLWPIVLLAMVGMPLFGISLMIVLLLDFGLRLLRPNQLKFS